MQTIDKLKDLIAKTEDTLASAKAELSKMTEYTAWAYYRLPKSGYYLQSNSACENDTTCKSCVDNVRDCYCGPMPYHDTGSDDDEMATVEPVEAGTYESEYDENICRYCGELVCRCEQAKDLDAPTYTFKVKSIVRWVENDNTYRSAVVTKTGLLQVKVVNNGVKYTDNTFYASGDDWANSLPKSGVIIVCPPFSALEKKINTPLKGPSDGHKLVELEQRFKRGKFYLANTYYPRIHIRSMYVENIYVDEVPMIQLNKGLCVNSFQEIIDRMPAAVPANSIHTLIVEYRGRTIGLTHLL
jgi:hypothetical protein